MVGGQEATMSQVRAEHLVFETVHKGAESLPSHTGSGSGKTPASSRSLSCVQLCQGKKVRLSRSEPVAGS